MKKVKALAALKAKHGGHDDQPTSTGQFIHEGRSVFSITAPVETPPSLPLLSNPPASKDPPPVPTSSVLPDKAYQQLHKEPKPQVLDQFLQQKDHISSTILADYASPLINKDCPCGVEGAVCTTRCRDCFFYPPTCNTCFIDAHRKSPTHWAHVWQPEGGYFLKTDISSLSSTPFIQLGHDGHPCKAVYEDDKQHNFIIVDNNGVHSTRLRFCACHGCPSPVHQLLQAQLFPATFEDTRTAFTFSVLKSYEAHHHESAESAYSFVTALRHLTDPLFYNDVADPYDQFRDVIKMWRLLKTEQRLGHQHGIDDVAPSRPPGSLLVWCPACPELGVNTDGTICEDKDLGTQMTILPRSLRVAGYFPDTEEYNANIKSPGKDKEADVEKTDCAFLKAANKQDKKKFIGCDISGVLNIQCPHVFILSSVDLELGEKFVSTDFALQRALSTRYLPSDYQQYLKYLATVDVILSYDISCAYSVHAASRLGQFRDITPFVNRLRYTIPLLHIQNHNDNCTYMYSSAYMEGAGHFHGETAEHPWPYTNLFASQGRQMSHGNRHDLLNGVYGYWNFKKVIGLVPSQIQIYNAMIALQSGLDNESATSTGKKARAPKPIDQRPVLCNMSVNVRRLQAQVKSKLKVKAQHPSQTVDTEIDSLRSRLTTSLASLRELQMQLFPSLSNSILEWSSLETDQVEDQMLGMPSDFEDPQRNELGLDDSADIERRLLEGAAFDTISRIRTSVQFVSALTGAKMTNLTGQNSLTRAASRVYDAQNLRDAEILFYNSIRGQLLRLGLPDDDPMFRHMDVASTSRKSTILKRQVGDTYKNDYDSHGRNSTGLYQRQTFHAHITPQSNESGSRVTTQSRKASKRKHEISPNRDSKKMRSDEASCTSTSSAGTTEAAKATVQAMSESSSAGWIWEPQAPSGISDEEVEDWMSEGNRVQWFRAEAEMYRWQEEWEHKVIEFSRAIRFHHHMNTVCLTLANNSNMTAGMAAYARHAAARCLELALRCTNVFGQGNTGYTGAMDEQQVFEFIRQDRQEFSRTVATRLAECQTV
ncbi:hypothetical protein BKA70DRAFT_1430575 [Coprinopsis sp. MPI-PUGE-AT-0042]|nr:hypothetical protein BKA70DRAFT_1430575 [Coprinopsis sp. MPI-PUGE-AT-0042]